MGVICCECKAKMGQKEGEGESHGICRPCLKKKHPGAYAYLREQEAMRRGAKSGEIVTVRLSRPMRVWDKPK